MHNNTLSATNKLPTSSNYNLYLACHVMIVFLLISMKQTKLKITVCIYLALDYLNAKFQLQTYCSPWDAGW